MIRKTVFFLIAFVIVFPLISSASGKSPDQLRAAFVRSENLWIKVGNKEQQITNGAYVRFPKWSIDGRWLAYLRGGNKGESSPYEGELWLYNLQHNKHMKVSHHVKNNFQWSPNDNRIAFLSEKNKKSEGFRSNDELYVTHTRSLQRKQVVEKHVSNFSWLPGGKGFLSSTKDGDQLDSDIVLSRIFIDKKGNKLKKQHFYTIPISKDEYYISTSGFKWSNDTKWISFLLVPTASLSADSNILFTLSADGKILRKAGDMLDHEEWFQWSPKKALLGFIDGVGRDAIINKKLKLLNPMDAKSKGYTPKGFVDRDLDWLDQKHLITARSIESDWVDIKKRPLPFLNKIDLTGNKQMKITNPPTGFGDFRPQHVKEKIVWIRSNRQAGDIWISNIDGSQHRKWIRHIDSGEWYYEKGDWEEVFSLYLPSVKK